MLLQFDRLVLFNRGTYRQDLELLLESYLGVVSRKLFKVDISLVRLYSDKIVSSDRVNY